MRILISRVRLVTEYIITPYNRQIFTDLLFESFDAERRHGRVDPPSNHPAFFQKIAPLNE